MLGSISAALLSVELKEMHNTVKVGSCSLICIDWLIYLLHTMVDRYLVRSSQIKAIQLH